MLRRTLFVPLLAALLLALPASAAPSPSPASCHVSQASRTCTISCLASEPVLVSGDSPDASTVAVALLCGSSMVAYCQDAFSCSAEGRAPIATTGTCVLLGGSGPSAEGTCASAPPLPAMPPCSGFAPACKPTPGAPSTQPGVVDARRPR